MIILFGTCTVFPQFQKWLGQCPACKEWNTLVEETVVTGKAGKSSKKTESLAARIHEAQPVKLSGIKTESEIRTATGFEELDRVLGGGIVAGSLVLVGGDPGIGKSTILLQVCKNLTEKGKKVLYISGEESLQQIKLRASRIGSFGEEMLLLCETSLETIQGVFCFIYRLRRGTAALIKIHQCLCSVIHTVFHFSVVVTLVCKNFDGISLKRYPVKAFFCLLIR